MAKKNIKVQNRIKKQKPDNQWFQNVAKSMGFTAADIVKDLLPNTNDFLEYTASDTFKMISDMKSNMSSRQMVNRQFKNIPQIKIANDAIKNMKSDLMSGKLYNKSRSEEFDFDDMDFGFGAFDDEDGMSFIDDDNDSGSSEDKTTHQTVINTLPLAKMINNSTEATVSTMVAVAEQQMAVESEKLLFNHRSTNSILGGLSAINDNLSTLVRFNADSTAKYHAASLKYYEESLEYIKNAGKKSTGNNTSEEAEEYARDIYTYKGNLIASEYKKIIKDNIKELREENAMLSDTLNILTDTSTIKDMAKNPIGTIMNIGIKSMIPAITKSSMKALDDSITSIIPAIMTRINSMEDDENPFKQAIFKVFGHKNKLSYDVDLGKYEKGSMSGLVYRGGVPPLRFGKEVDKPRLFNGTISADIRLRARRAVLRLRHTRPNGQRLGRRARHHTYNGRDHDRHRIRRRADLHQGHEDKTLGLFQSAGQRAGHNLSALFADMDGCRRGVLFRHRPVRHRLGRVVRVKHSLLFRRGHILRRLVRRYRKRRQPLGAHTRLCKAARYRRRLRKAQTQHTPPLRGGARPPRIRGQKVQKAGLFVCIPLVQKSRRRPQGLFRRRFAK